jgi:hypothetical protein
MAKFDAKKADLNKDGQISRYEKKRGEATTEAMPMAKVGYTMEYGTREKDSPTTFRTDAVMRMSPMLMNHDKKVDTSSYSADTSSAFSTPSFEGSQGQNYASNRTETTSTDSEVIPGDTKTETKTVTYDDLYNNAISDGKTPEEAQKIVQEARDYNTKKYGTHNPTAEGLADNTITTTTQGDDQTIQTTKTDVDQSPTITDNVLVGKREQKYMEKTRKRLTNDQSKMRKALAKAEKKYGTESPEYENAQKSYQGAIQSLSRFEEGRSQGATTGGTFKTGLVQTNAQTDFENQQNQKQRSQNYADMFQQGADRIGTSQLADLSSNTSPDSDIMSNIFGTPSFMIKPMQFRAQEGSKTSRTGKSKSGGLNRRNNY